MSIDDVLKELTTPFEFEVTDRSLTARFSRHRVAKAADGVLTAAGRQRYSLDNKAIPWIEGWRAAKNRLEASMRHPNGETFLDRRERIDRFFESLSDSSRDYCFNKLRLKGGDLVRTDDGVLRTHLHSKTTGAYHRAALSCVKAGALLIFEPQDNSLVFLSGHDATVWRSPQKRRKDWRFLITDELPLKATGGDRGGLRSVAKVQVEREAEEALRKIVSANDQPAPKADVVSTLRYKFPELSKKAAERLWDAVVPVAWKAPGPKKRRIDPKAYWESQGHP